MRLPLQFVFYNKEDKKNQYDYYHKSHWLAKMLNIRNFNKNNQHINHEVDNDKRRKLLGYVSMIKRLSKMKAGVMILQSGDR